MSTRKAVFLDRDGVINKYPGDKKYVTSWEGFRFLPGVKKALARLAKNNFAIFIASNQAGVGKGIFSQKELDNITTRMLKEVACSGGRIDSVYYCTHRPEDNCSCRKPKPEMLTKASRARGINLKKTFFIGDTLRDIHTARRAGCRSILLLCGKENLSNRKNWEVEPDFVFKDLLTAVDLILEEKK